MLQDPRGTDLGVGRPMSAYSDITKQAFERALDELKTALPKQLHSELVRLLEEESLHDAAKVHKAVQNHSSAEPKQNAD